MKKPWTTYALCGLAIAASAAAAVTSGTALKFSALLFRNHYNHMLAGKPLPMLTEFVLSTSESFSPALAGALLALLTLLVGFGLLFLAADERSACLRTLWCTTITWTLVFVTLGTALLAFAMPMSRIMYGMQNHS